MEDLDFPTCLVVIIKCPPLSMLRQCLRKPGTKPGFLPPSCGNKVLPPILPILHYSVEATQELALEPSGGDEWLLTSPPWWCQ